MQLLFQIHFSSWVWHEWGRQTVCRGCICTYLQSTPQPLDPTGACHFSVLIQRIESCLQQLAGGNKATCKGKKPMSTNIPAPGGDLGGELGEHHTRLMHGREGSGHGDRSSTNSCWWPAPQWLREASPHLALSQVEPERAAPICSIPTPLAAASP